MHSKKLKNEHILAFHLESQHLSRTTLVRDFNHISMNSVYKGSIRAMLQISKQKSCKYHVNHVISCKYHVIMFRDFQHGGYGTFVYRVHRYMVEISD